MQDTHPLITLIEETGVVAIVRRAQPFDAPALARALVDGGIQVLEITLNSHNALEAITAVRSLALPNLRVGAGTVRTADDARRALEVGAEFLVAPNFDRAAVDVAHAAGVPMLPGVATPSEAVAAWQAGCQLLKLFPAAALGVQYLKLIRDPLPDLRFMATGGVERDNLAEFFRAGAVAVGLGSSLVGKADTSPAEITERARAIVAAIGDARHG
jgi:2-dehydro-3-deoxyphosphogluconate aldolase/(4S)-4-hydroxy-2-oxoglutarate aldolase